MSESTGAVRDAELLTVYCNDHLAAAAGGIGLVERMLRVHARCEHAPSLRSLHAELLEERAGLQRMMAALGLPVRRSKQLAVRLAQKLSWFKPNGRLVRRSPLSTVVEYEFLTAAVLAKRAGFESLLGLSAEDPRLDRALLDDLIRQADRQHRWLARTRREVAAEVFGGRAASADDSSAT